MLSLGYHQRLGKEFNYLVIKNVLWNPGSFQQVYFAADVWLFWTTISILFALATNQAERASRYIS